MRLVLAAALALPLATAAAAQQSGPATASECRPDGSVARGTRTPEVRPRTLAEMPPAVEIKALWNVVDGCTQPIVVRRGLGAPGPAAPPGR